MSLSTRQRIQERNQADPHGVRFEDLDLTPMEEAIHNPPRETMREIVAQYVRSMQSQDEEPSSAIDDFEDVDPEEQVITDYQILAIAYEELDDDDVPRGTAEVEPSPEAPPIDPGTDVPTSEDTSQETMANT